MSNFRDLVKKVLKEIGITVSNEGQHIHYTHRVTNCDCTINTKIIFSSDSEIIVYSSPRFKIPALNRKKTSKYINRQNVVSHVGCIEMDMNDGEIRFRTTLRHNEATDVEPILGAMIALHHTYFSEDVCPMLKILADETNLTPPEDLVCVNNYNFSIS